MSLLTKQRATELFQLSGFDVLNVKELIDGYGYPGSDPRFTQEPPRCCWYFIKTEFGWFEIGNRKRVISIDWTETSIRTLATTDDVTKSDTCVHAWDEEKAMEYLRALRLFKYQERLNQIISMSDIYGKMGTTDGKPYKPEVPAEPPTEKSRRKRLSDDDLIREYRDAVEVQEQHRVAAMISTGYTARVAYDASVMKRAHLEKEITKRGMCLPKISPTSQSSLPKP